MYLLDTNVVSELRRPRPHGGVAAWVSAAPLLALHVCAFTIGELQSGVERTRKNDRDKAAALDAWIDSVPARFNVISIDAECFRVWAKMLHGKPAHLYGDAMIAACAARHQLTVVTRNVRDFALFPVLVLDPFEALSPTKSAP